MKTNQNRENLTLVLALSRSYQHFMRTLTPLFKQADLTPSQWDILETLSSKGPMSVNDLLNALLSTSGNLDVVVKNLIKAELVEKTVDVDDRRSRLVSLTNKGKEKVESFYPIHNKALETIFQQLSASNKQQLIKNLNQLRKKLSPLDEVLND